LIPIYLSAILNGVLTTMLGPLLPGFAARWNLDDARGGLLFSAQFIASVLTAVTVGFLAKRFGYWRVLALGCGLAALGVAGCSTASWPLTLFSVGVYGCGLGVITPAANLGLAAAAGGDSARSLLWLNLFWSIGAVAAPALVATLHAAFLPSLAFALLAAAAWIAMCGPGLRPARMSGTGLAAVFSGLGFAVILFLYVGAESSVSGWVSTYATRTAAARSLWAVLPSVFWGSILLGRLLSPGLLQRISRAALARAGLLCALLGAALLIVAGGPVALVVGSALTGFGFAPIFPVMVASFADRAGGGSLSGLVFCAAGLGGGLIPPLVGVVSTASGSLRLGLATVLVLIVAMLILEARVVHS
jgi:fucose permease